MDIKIPKKLRGKLEAEISYSSSVLSLINWLQTIFSKAPTFFPEYTDHGVKHVNDVLNDAEKLIPDEAWEYITPEDAATLVAAILIHDIGLFLDEEGFNKLRSETLVNLKQSQRFPTDKSWSELWDDFCGTSIVNRRLSNDINSWSNSERKLVGEFLRRHHTRLSYEVATQGFPIHDGRKPICQGFREEVQEWIGIIARSHGESIEKAVANWLKEGEESLDRTHIPYLMVVLCAADCLQIKSERAPRQAMDIYAIRNENSKLEWHLHQLVLDVSFNQGDPELIYISFKEIAPNIKDNNESLLINRMDKLLSNIQDQFAESGKILGEIYGPTHKSLTKLAKSRIDSNLALIKPEIREGLQESSQNAGNAKISNLIVFVISIFIILLIVRVLSNGTNIEPTYPHVNPTAVNANSLRCNMLPKNFSIGGKGIVVVAHSDLALRLEPRTSSELVEWLGNGDKFNIIGGPECNSDKKGRYFWWWQIRLIDNQGNILEGWVADGKDDTDEQFIKAIE